MIQTAEVQIIPMIIWEPQPKQAQFLERAEYEACYGGSAGGGKSDSLLAEALRQVDIPHYRGIVFRKTVPQLSELIDRSIQIYSPAYPKAVFNQNKLCWQFPSGAKIYFGHMQYSKDKTKYQGKRYDFIGFDELTHFTYEEYSYMFSRNRPGGPGTRCYIRATCNPGGIGHGWVKERFIQDKEPYKRYFYKMTIEGVEYTRDRVFIPSNVFDNKILLQNNPDYVANLALLPEAERKALLYGDWNSFSGQVFREFRNNSEGYYSQQDTHVIAPFIIPDTWRRYRSFDFGYAKPFSVGWWAVDPNTQIVYRYRELYGCTATPNEGVKWTVQEIAQEIKKIENEFDKGKHIIGVADPSIWDSSRGDSIAEAFEKEGIFWEKGDNKRLPGKMQLHYRFKIDENTKKPMLYVFNTCKEFIRIIPALVYDDTHVEDINTSIEDHIYDETRYFLMHETVKFRTVPKGKANTKYNPLEDDKPNNMYGFMKI